MRLTDQQQDTLNTIIQHTQQYGTDERFKGYWRGFTRESRNVRAQQTRAFGELVGEVTQTLEGWKILDFGCGNGRWLRTFLEYDANATDLVGVDISDLRFETARAKNPLITYQKIDGVNLPFPDATFDLVTQFVCYSNIPTHELRQQVTAEITRVLKPGGYVFWWDLPRTTAPADRNQPLVISHYYTWAVKQLLVGELPQPSESIKPLRGLTMPLRLFANMFRFPVTHVAALIGPKP